jgi:hypothetical protein
LVDKGEARLFRRKDGKFLIYLAKDFAEDSQFPFKLTEQSESIKLEAAFTKDSIILRKL